MAFNRVLEAWLVKASVHNPWCRGRGRRDSVPLYWSCPESTLMPDVPQKAMLSGGRASLSPGVRPQESVVT